MFMEIYVKISNLFHVKGKKKKN